MISTSTTSYQRKRWVIAPADGAAVEQLARQLRVPAMFARLLVNRGLTDPSGAAAFLEPQFRDLHPPALLPNIEVAAERIARAVRAGEKITLYGDYDVDGITGTAMLWHTLQAAGAQVDFYIPHRVEEGYGLNSDAIDGLIEKGTRLLITVDCGCSAVVPIGRAQSRGVDVIVSDHHEFAPQMPPACALVHPRRHPLDPLAATAAAYPNPDLCGAGVAFKLAWAVAQKLCNAERVNQTYRDLLVEFAALVALGTVADVVPLTGENRILVRFGLGQLLRTRFEGLRALIAAAGYGGDKKIDCMAIGFTLGPRLNAAGRMGHARQAVELLTTASGERATEIATWLEQQNRQRQATEKRMADLARQQIEERQSKSDDGAEELVLVAAHESFHAGVVGIVASRLVDLYHRPAFVLFKNHVECHGSARSIEGFQLHEAIEHVRDLLTSGGGHAMAGGVRLPLANLEAFRERLNAFARDRLTDEQLVPSLPVDDVLDLADCNPQVIAMLEKLEPFGRGNPQPRFLVENVRLSAPPRRVGATGAHLQLTVSRPPNVARCIAFRMGDIEPELPVGTEVNLIVEPRVDEWQGRVRVDLVVVDIAKCNEEPLGRRG
jgi:single-stranded-DNA-specific exonuclease